MAEELQPFTLQFQIPHTFLARILWIRLNSVGSVLDVACGDGCVYWMSFMLKVGEVSFVVPRMEVVSLDKQNAPKVYGKKKNYPKIKVFVQGDAEMLPFKDKSFDTITVTETLEHPLDPVRVLSEAKRVGRKRILVTVPDEGSWIKRRLFRHFSIIDSTEHVRLFNSEKLKRYFREVNLSSYKIEHMLFGGVEYYTAIINLER